MIAAAAVTEDEQLILDAGLAQIPEKCRLRRDIEAVCGWFQEGLSETAVTDKIHALYNEYDAHEWYHTMRSELL